MQNAYDTPNPGDLLPDFDTFSQYFTSAQKLYNAGLAGNMLSPFKNGGTMHPVHP
jgi:hypothetical protein